MIGWAEYSATSRDRRVVHLVGSKIYAPTNNGTHMGIVDCATDVYSEVDMGVTRFRLCSGVNGSLIYMPASGAAVCGVYNTASASYSEFAITSRTRIRPGAVVGTKLFAPSPSLWGVIDMASNTYVERSYVGPASTPIGPAVAVGTNVYVIVRNNSDLTIWCQVLDTATLVATRFAVIVAGSAFQFLQSTESTQPVVNGSTIHFFGENNTGGWLYSLDTSTQTATRTAQSLSGGRYYAKVGRLVYGPRATSNVVDLWDLSTLTVSTFAPSPAMNLLDLTTGKAVFYQNRIYLMPTGRAYFGILLNVLTRRRRGLGLVRG